MKLTQTSWLGLVAMLSCATPALAADASSLVDALLHGTPTLDARYRLEIVDQDGMAKEANASTLRTRLGYRTGSLDGFYGYLEFENIAVIGDTTYNNTINGKTQYPVVADPASTEVNQAYFAYQGRNGLAIKAGRQEINLGNQRFFGTVAWRQNEQTFDAVTAAWTSGKFSAAGTYVFNVNRVFSDRSPVGDFKTNTEALQVAYKFSPLLEVSALGLLIDLNTDNLAMNATNSSQTFGIHVAGAAPVAGGVKLGYSADYARQSDFATSAVNYNAPYYAIEGYASGKRVTGRVGYEVMGSDNGVGFQTPLATLHKFDGWADKFLTTPTNGLKDIYVGLSTKTSGEGPLGGIMLDAAYHAFSADRGSITYGKEFDWQVTKKLSSHLDVAVKGAHYRADSFAADTDKYWVSLHANF